MSKITINLIKIKRAITAAIFGYTPEDGELLYDTTTKRLRVGNGSTSGGEKIRVEVSDVDGIDDYLTQGDIVNDNNYYANRRLDMIDGQSTQYIILCKSAGGNNVNGSIQIDRTSGNWQSAKLDIVVSSNTSAMQGGNLQTQQVTQSNEEYELGRLYLPSTGVNYIAIKYTGNAYPETRACFTGILTSSAGSKTLTSVASESGLTWTKWQAKSLCNTQSDDVAISGNMVVEGEIADMARHTGIYTLTWPYISYSKFNYRNTYIASVVLPAGYYIIDGSIRSMSDEFGEKKWLVANNTPSTDSIGYLDNGVSASIRGVDYDGNEADKHVYNSRIYTTSEVPQGNTTIPSSCLSLTGNIWGITHILGSIKFDSTTTVYMCMEHYAYHDEDSVCTPGVIRFTKIA